ncbi:hypothetical protein EW145_g2074 [Phellinidium pouzarii]|uniref:Uncharacterized protein n=1 Tax=Phellinidium pouzarii TaxID=167371 RepID=A0A4S4LCQ6_9AGAM|nr:hypothetical protein EW145_g2074 [Phellinidium pouzarii]
MSDNTTLANDVFRASVPDIRAFAGLLRGICFSNSNQRATMTINKAGIVVFVEEARTLLGAALIVKELFDEFVYIPEDGDGDDDDRPTVLSFQLNTILECLNIFGTASGSGSLVASHRQAWRKTNEESDNENQGNVQKTGQHGRAQNNVNGNIDSFFPRADGKGTGMRLSYAGEGHGLVLLLAENSNGPTTTCELVTYEAEPQLDLPLDNRNVARQRAVSRPLLRIQAVGPFGSTEMDYPNDREVLETFECDSTVSYIYRFSHITRTLRALQGSSKTSLRIDGQGVLSLQFLSTSPSPKTGTQVDSIVDFRCLSIDDEM